MNFQLDIIILTGYFLRQHINTEPHSKADSFCSIYINLIIQFYISDNCISSSIVSKFVSWSRSKTKSQKILSF